MQPDQYDLRYAGNFTLSELMDFVGYQRSNLHEVQSITINPAQARLLSLEVTGNHRPRLEKNMKLVDYWELANEKPIQIDTLMGINVETKR